VSLSSRKTKRHARERETSHNDTGKSALSLGHGIEDLIDLTPPLRVRNEMQKQLRVHVGLHQHAMLLEKLPQLVLLTPKRAQATQDKRQQNSETPTLTHQDPTKTAQATQDKCSV